MPKEKGFKLQLSGKKNLESNYETCRSFDDE